MENKKYSLWSIFAFGIFCLFMGFSACSEEEPGEEFTAPSISNNGATNVERTRITLSGTFKGNLGKVATYGVKYSESSNFPPDKTIVVTLSEAIQTSCTTTLTDLSPNTHYYYCWFASTGLSESTSTPGEFTTTSTSMPTFGEVLVDSIGENMMRLSCTVDEIGDNYLIEYGFSYKLSTTDQAYIPVAASELVDEATRKFTVELTGLKAATTYLVRAYAKNSGTKDASDGVKEGYSTVLEQTTANQLSPELETIDLNNVGINSVVAVGKVTSALGSDGVITERGFCYSSEHELPTIYDSKQVAEGKTLNEDYQTTLTGLAQLTTYYVRAYAKNMVNGEERVGYGDVLTCTTGALITPNVSLGYYDEVSQTYLGITTTASTATVYGFIENFDSKALLERGFVWSLDDPLMTIDKAEEAGTIIKVTSTDRIYFANITGLKPDTRYHVRAYAIYEAAGQQTIGYSGDNSFYTNWASEARLKDLTFDDDKITFSSIPMSCGISELGDGEFVEKGFLWKKWDGNWDLSLEEDKYEGFIKVEDGTNDSYSYVLSGLEANTEYMLRSYVKTKLGEEVYVGYSNLETKRTTELKVFSFCEHIESKYGSIKVKAGLTNLGDLELVERGFLWKKYDGNWDNFSLVEDQYTGYAKVEDGTNEEFLYTIPNLEPASEYIVKAYVKIQKDNKVYIGYSDGFHTSSGSIDVSQINIEDVLNTSCNVTISMNTDITDAQEYGIWWVESDNDEEQNRQTKACTNWDSSAKTFSTSLDGLKENTTYHLGVYIKVNDRIVYGNGSTGFTTKKAPGKGDNVSPDKKD